MGAAKEVHITIRRCSRGFHAAHRLECATVNDCNIMTVLLKASNCWRHFELPLTKFGVDDNDTNVLCYTHIILASRFTQLN